MKKIVVDARCIFDSGIGVYIREVLSRLVSLNMFDVSVIVLKEQQPDFLKLGIDVNHIHCVNFGRYSLRNLYALNRLLKPASFYFMPALSVTPILSKVKRIVVVHDLCPIALWRFFGFYTAVAYWSILGVQILFSKKILCISDFTKSQVLHYFTSIFKSKISVIHNGLSKRYFNKKFKNDFNKLQKPYLLCVGNIKPHKNVINLVNFFVSKSQFSTSHTLVVVGKSEGFRTGIDMPIENSDSVKFTGFVSDEELASFYKNADAYVFPSFYEGFGLPILEAMSFQLPILASNIPVFKEIAGDDVVYFNPNDFNDFDFNLTRLLNNPKKDYSELLASFTWEHCVGKIVDVLNK